MKETSPISILIITILDILFIAVQAFTTALNITWSPWFDNEGMFAAMLLLFHPVSLIAIVVLLCLNFLLNETHFSGKILLITAGNQLLMIFLFNCILNLFQNRSYFFTIVNSVSLVFLCVFIVAILLILINCVKIFYERMRLHI